MNYNILIVEKTPEEYEYDYGPLEVMAEAISFNLKSMGHTVDIVRGLDKVGDEEYAKYVRANHSLFHNPVRKILR